MKDNHLLDEHFITRDEMRELILLVEKLEQGIEHLKRDSHELKADVVMIRDEMVDSLTFRMFIIASLFGFAQIIFRFW